MSDDKDLRPADPSAILPAIQDLKASVLAELRNRDPFWWKVTQVTLPVVLTTLLGAAVWMFQLNVQKHLDDQMNVSKTQLAYTQYLYERRLEAYRETYDNVLATLDSLQAAAPNGPDAKAAKDRLHRNLQALSDLANKNKLFASTALNALLEDIWRKTIKGEDIDADALKSQVAQTMREDLLVDSLRIEAPKQTPVDTNKRQGITAPTPP